MSWRSCSTMSALVLAVLTFSLSPGCGAIRLASDLAGAWAVFVADLDADCIQGAGPCKDVIAAGPGDGVSGGSVAYRPPDVAADGTDPATAARALSEAGVDVIDTDVCLIEQGDQLVGQLGNGPGLLSLEAAGMPTAAPMAAAAPAPSGCGDDMW